MKNIIGAFLVLTMTIGYSQNMWKAATNSPGDKWDKIQVHRLELNMAGISARTDQSSFVLQIPMPDGRFSEFSLQEASILQPGLQAKYPSIRTYKGQNQQGDVMRMDMGPNGFHGIIFSKEKGTIYIDPSNLKRSEYVSYYRSDYKALMEKPHFEENEQLYSEEVKKYQPIQQKATNHRESGAELRSYRIAIAADNAYSSFHGGSVQGVLAAIVTTMNRVTGIYENEVAVTFTIVDDNDQIIYTDANSDPYNGQSASGALTVNQSNLDNVIGTENYDIGHVFTTGSGGLAGLGVVCSSTNKARGTTGTSSPTGDPFDVDFVAHEIGHQFGGNHTFNGSQGSCSGGNRNASTAYEPGSGSTIMAYAGICSADNIQNNSDAYFHVASLDEILTFVAQGGGSTCPSTSNTGNTPPQVQAPEGGFAIPINTPFYLTAEGSDTDNDVLTYNWEQFDLGDAGSPSAPVGSAPLFRSYTATENPTRYFPKLEDVVVGTSVFGEILPGETREMNFRVTARDNNAAGGGTNTDNIEFEVTDAAGPFEVTSQSTAETFQGGSAQLIQWNVANTDKSPVLLDSVRILLSLDGGVTFGDTLLHATLNDGEAYVILPNEASSEARIMVAAVGNIFYNVNASNFTIEQSAAESFDLIITETPGITCENTLAMSIEAFGTNGFASPIDLALTSASSLSFDLSSSSISDGETVSLTITNTGAVGEKSITLTGSSGGSSKDVNFNVQFLEGLTATATNVMPEDNAQDVDLIPDFTWDPVDGASSYNFTLASDPNFDNILAEGNQLLTTSYELDEELASNGTFFWRLSALNECGEGPAVEQSFTTIEVVEQNFVASDLPLSIVDLQTATSTLNISDNLVIYDLDIVNLDITHTWIEDLTITLTSPTGTSVNIIDQICGSDDDILLNLDDAATEVIPCPADDGGTYRPGQLLSAFNGEGSQGDWTLAVFDGANEDPGTLNGWGLSIKSAAGALVLGATATTFDQVQLEWNDVEDDLGYEVEQEGASGEFTKIMETAQDITQATVTGLDDQTEYRFRVRAILSEGFSAYSSTAVATTLLGLPDSPSDLEASQFNSSAISLSWADNSDSESGFSVERSENGTDFSEIATSGINTERYVDNSIESGTEYYYRISSFNDAGISESSNVTSILILSIDEVASWVYPNPADQYVVLSKEYVTKFDQLQIVNLKGQIMDHIELGKVEPTDLRVHLKGFDTGMYILQLMKDGYLRREIKLLKK